MDNYNIFSLGIATQGLININPSLIAMQGFLIKITEEIVEIPIIQKKGGGVGYVKRQNVVKQLRKKITIIVFKDDKQYKKTVYYKNLKITPNDINVKFDEKDKPKIKVSLK